MIILLFILTMEILKNKLSYLHPNHGSGKEGGEEVTVALGS